MLKTKEDWDAEDAAEDAAVASVAGSLMPHERKQLRNEGLCRCVDPILGFTSRVCRRCGRVSRRREMQ